MKWQYGTASGNAMPKTIDARSMNYGNACTSAGASTMTKGTDKILTVSLTAGNSCVLGSLTETNASTMIDSTIYAATLTLENFSCAFRSGNKFTIKRFHKAVIKENLRTFKDSNEIKCLLHATGTDTVTATFQFVAFASHSTTLMVGFTTIAAFFLY
jgi:hypothetical protein